MIWKREGGGHILGSSYAEHKYGHMIWGGGVKNCLGCQRGTCRQYIDKTEDIDKKKTRHRQDIETTQTRHRQDTDKTQTTHRQHIDNTQTRHRQDTDKTQTTH